MSLYQITALKIILTASLFVCNNANSEEKAPDRAKRSVKIVALGDSLTEGYGVSANQAYPSLLQQELEAKGYGNVEVINAGVSGATSASGTSRLNWHLRGKQLPDVVILALGANDGLRGIDLKTTKANLEKTITMAKEKNIAVVLAGMMLPPNYGEEYTKVFKKMYEDLAKQHKLILIPFLLEGVAAKPELNLPDGIHPNAEGYKIVVKNVLPYVERALQ